MKNTFKKFKGDGTYTNPIIYSDFPNSDVIQIDATLYGKE
jgi:hypothetical protein